MSMDNAQLDFSGVFLKLFIKNTPLFKSLLHG